MSNNYRGFSLFNDVEDEALRTRNRAVVLSNIAESHIKNRRISPNGAGLILGYFTQIPVEEREKVKNQFVKQMEEKDIYLVQG